MRRLRLRRLAVGDRVVVHWWAGGREAGEVTAIAQRGSVRVLFSSEPPREKWCDSDRVARIVAEKAAVGISDPPPPPSPERPAHPSYTEAPS